MSHFERAVTKSAICKWFQGGKFTKLNKTHLGDAHLVISSYSISYILFCHLFLLYLLHFVLSANHKGVI